MRNMRFYGDPVLRRKTKRVDRFDADLRELADDLLRTMRETKGVGLAANQVGDLRRVFAIDPSAGDRE